MNWNPFSADPYGVMGSIKDKFLGGDAAKEQAKLANEQIKAYREQTEISKAELDRKRGEEQVEKRRVEEKQIRGLRRNFRSPGLLGSGGGVGGNPVSDKLGA